MNKVKTLTSDADLFTAALLQYEVQIWGRTVDDVLVLLQENGLITKFSNNQIVVNGHRFVRDECVVRIEMPAEDVS
ncbi:hypothetical protein [Marinicrinis sediminis]|uniref:Uncharacterized protein n=1 Tax=Marinicrinis sediminis TaxID=1652465 RepID=A0ABW5R9W2_9BACL